MRDCLADIVALAEIDLAEKPKAYSEAMRAAYWEDKDLAGAIAIAFAGIGRMLAEAHSSDATRGYELRSGAKALTFDVASFTWPGWDEPGIVITPPEQRAGSSAARANLRMAEELEKGDLPMSRAHWMVGAHELASAHHEEARTSFEKAAAHADRAGESAEAELARAFAALALVAGDASQTTALETALARLASMPDGARLVTQVETARSALGT
jgi:hypothetical protein